MSEEIAGTPPVVGQPTGIEQQPGQPQGTPPISGEPTPPVQPKAEGPTVEQLQAELERMREQSRYHQSRADQEAARVRAMAGVSPVVDPLAQDVQHFTKAGYDEKDARVMAEFVNSKISPLTEQLTRANAAVQATSQVDQVLQQAATTQPKLFSDPRVFQYAREELQKAALSGQLDYVNPAYAKTCGMMKFGEINDPDATPQQQQAHLQQPPRSMNFGGPMPGFTPAAPAAKQANPLTDQLAKQMADYVAIPKQS